MGKNVALTLALCNVRSFTWNILLFSESILYLKLKFLWLTEIWQQKNDFHQLNDTAPQVLPMCVNPMQLAVGMVLLCSLWHQCQHFHCDPSLLLWMFSCPITVLKWLLLKTVMTSSMLWTLDCSPSSFFLTLALCLHYHWNIWLTSGSLVLHFSGSHPTSLIDNSLSHWGTTKTLVQAQNSPLNIIIDVLYVK